MTKQLFISFFILFTGLVSFSSTEIEGYTFKAFKGKKVNLIQYKDYITKEYDIMSTTTIDTAGKFNFSIDIKETQEAIIQIEYLIGIIYLDPNQNYTIYFPPSSADGTYKLTRNNVNIVFKTIPKNDINGLILEFDRLYDQFLMDNRYHVGNKLFHNKLDSFKKEVSLHFKGVSNTYFKKYVKYSIANLELVSPASHQKINKLSLYNTYIINKKINYNHPIQMKFLLNFYEKSLQNQIGKVGQEISNALEVSADYTAIDTSLQKDYFFKMKSIRELVITENLFTLFHEERYDPNKVLSLLETIKLSTKTKEIETLISTITHKLTRMSPGAKAFPFELIDKNGDRVSLQNFAGNYVYINFWAVWNKDSQAEMDLFKKMKSEYGEFVKFVSINVDSKKSKFDHFIASHPDYDWSMLYFEGKSNLLDHYEVFNLPHYILIDTNGNIMASPAKKPSPNGDYLSIDKTFFELKKTMKTKKKFNIGIK